MAIDFNILCSARETLLCPFQWFFATLRFLNCLVDDFKIQQIVLLCVQWFFFARLLLLNCSVGNLQIQHIKHIECSDRSSYSSIPIPRVFTTLHLLNCLADDHQIQHIELSDRTSTIPLQWFFGTILLNFWLMIIKFSPLSSLSEPIEKLFRPFRGLLRHYIF